MFVKLGRRHRLLLPALRKLKLYSSYLSKSRLSRLDHFLELETRKMLVINTELKRISKILEINGIKFRNLKGPGITGLLYSDPADRMSRDIDILIEFKNINKAIQVLTENNIEIYKDYSDYNKENFNELFRRNNQMKFVSSKTNILIELHWKLFKHNWIPKNVNTEYDLSKIYVDYSSLSTENILFLIIHGGIHFWNRLFWLRDIHFIYMNRPDLFFAAGKLAERYHLERLYFPLLNLLSYIYNHKIKLNDNIEFHGKLSNFCIKRILIHYDIKTFNSIVDSIIYKMKLKRSIFFKLKIFFGSFYSISYISKIKFPGIFRYLNYPLIPFYIVFDYLKIKTK